MGPVRLSLKQNQEIVFPKESSLHDACAMAKISEVVTTLKDGGRLAVENNLSVPVSSTTI